MYINALLNPVWEELTATLWNLDNMSAEIGADFVY